MPRPQVKVIPPSCKAKVSVTFVHYYAIKCKKIPPSLFSSLMKCRGAALLNDSN